MAQDTIGKTFGVALGVCLVCSVLVSAAVSLKPAQEENKALDKKRNILMAAGLLKAGESAGPDRVIELWRNVEARVVDLSTGDYTDVDPYAFDARRAALDPAQSEEIPPGKDLAKIKRRAKLSDVYVISEGGRVRKVIVPVSGKGLWSTLYGFLALDTKDVNKFEGWYFTSILKPWIGGEVDNPNRKALWDGKKAYGDGGAVKIDVLKGRLCLEIPTNSIK